MTFLPIVDRELRVAARLSATYRNRTLVAGAVALIALAILFFGSFGNSLRSLGASMFQILSVLTLLFCVFEGARKTADCLSEEKREGTLGLLFLTDLKGYDIVLGKLVGMSLSSFYGLFSILPVLALPLLLGGVLAGEYWRMMLALLNVLFFSLCAGMLISTVSREEQKAMGGALLLSALICGPPLIWGPLRPLSPVFAFYTAFDANYPLGGYWMSLGMGQLLGWAMLVAACFIVPRVWLEGEVKIESGRWWRPWQAWRPRNPARRAQVRTQTLARNPVLWLAAHQAGTGSPMYAFALAALLGPVGFFFAPDPFMPFYFGGCYVLNFIIKAWIASQACRFNARARRNGNLEMMLVSPLTSDQITAGQIQALVRVFLPAVSVTLGVELLGLFLGLTLSTTYANPDVAGAVVYIFLYLLLFGCDIAAVMWAGMWFGLSAKKESQAITKTVAYVLVAPYLAIPVCWCSGIPVLFFSSVVWIIWAKNRLQTGFREYATGREPRSHMADATLLPVPSFTRRPPPLPPIQD